MRTLFRIGFAISAFAFAVRVRSPLPPGKASRSVQLCTRHVISILRRQAGWDACRIVCSRRSSRRIFSGPNEKVCAISVNAFRRREAGEERKVEGHTRSIQARFSIFTTSGMTTERVAR
jgi:hypothetical protein